MSKNQFPSISRENRLKAIEEGKPFYTSGTKCKKCGKYEKYVSNSSCVECIKISTLNRDPTIYKKYCESEKGQDRIKKYRKTKVYKKVQQTWLDKSGYGCYTQSKRRKQIKQTIKDLPKDELLLIKKLYEQAAKLRKDTGKIYHVDHIIRLADGGSHCIDNLQILDEDTHRAKTVSENIKKKGGVR